MDNSFYALNETNIMDTTHIKDDSYEDSDELDQSIIHAKLSRGISKKIQKVLKFGIRNTSEEKDYLHGIPNDLKDVEQLKQLILDTKVKDTDGGSPKVKTGDSVNYIQKETSKESQLDQ